MKGRLVFITAAVALVAAACTKEDNGGNGSAAGEMEICFSSSPAQMRSGSVVEDATLPSKEWMIIASATQYDAEGHVIKGDYFHDAPFVTTDTNEPVSENAVYAGVSPKYWPAGTGTMRFLAYAVPDSVRTKGYVTAEYNADNKADTLTIQGWDTYAHQTDLLYASIKDAPYPPASNSVNYNFNHAQAVLSFKIKTGAAAIEIDSIVIPDLKVKGDFCIGNRNGIAKGQWKNLETVAEKDTLPGLPKSFTTDGEIGSLLIPEQNCRDIRVRYKVGAGTELETKNITAAAIGTLWKAGQTCTLTLDFTTP